MPHEDGSTNADNMVVVDDTNYVSIVITGKPLFECKLCVGNEVIVFADLQHCLQQIMKYLPSRKIIIYLHLQMIMIYLHLWKISDTDYSINFTQAYFKSLHGNQGFFFALLETLSGNKFEPNWYFILSSMFSFIHSALEGSALSLAVMSFQASLVYMTQLVI